MAPLLSGCVWGGLLVLVLAIEHLAPLRRLCASVAAVLIGAAIRVGLID